MRLARRLVATLIVLAVMSSASCVTTLPGQAGYRATITVLNRTTADLLVSSGEGGYVEFNVPPCDEATRADFPVNFWRLTSPGRDSFHSGGGSSASVVYLLVTSSVAVYDARPNSLPACDGLLQPASAAQKATALAPKSVKL